MIHIVEEIKLLLLLGNRLKHFRGSVSYLMTCVWVTIEGVRIGNRTYWTLATRNYK
jgi:hypothetical protein